MITWQLQQAKANFSKVIKDTAHEPQGITLHGELVSVILSKKEYEKLTQPKPSFVEFMRNSPLVGVELNIKRNKSLNRDIEL